ncbi:MAG TPA: hypothetical protein VMM83_04550 [Longimicrobiales bacterium]|nr:hypothetical protein [Longimicrobiales bacterium]
MSPTGQAIRSAVVAAVRRVRRDGYLAVGLAIAAIAPAALLVALAWGPAGRIARGAGPLTFLAFAALVAGVLAVWLGRRWVSAVDEAGVAAAAERRRGLAEGSLRGVLELGRQLSPGGSDALVRHSETDLAGRLTGARPSDLAGDVGDRARRRRWRAMGVAGALTGMTILAAFGAPERARGAWAPLLSPVAMLSAPSLPPLVVRPGDAEVPRGQPLDVLVEAPYRDRVVVRWRATGDVPRARTLQLAGGSGSLTLGAVEAPLVYWVEAPDGAVSDSFRVRPIDPLLVSALTVEVVYPPHVGREPDSYAGEPPALRIPEGTRIRAWGSATRPLQELALVRADGREVSGAVRASGFSVDWRPRVEDSGLWDWRLTGADASAESTPPAPLDVTVVEDAPPVVRITVPGADELMPVSFRQQVVADASDDHGVAGAALLFRRVTAAGERGPERSAALRIEAGADRMLIRTVLDASEEALVPGDAIHYRVVVRDNSPGGQTASSAEHVLRLPSMSELRDRAREDAGAALAEAERVAERTRDLQSATRDLSRQTAGRSGERRTGSQSGRPSQANQLGFEEAGEARQVLEGQEELLDEVAALERRMAELQRAVAEAGLQNPDLQRRLEELREMYSELARPEMAADLEQLREAVEALDPAAVREALERLAARQDELRQAMEESLELMRRAAAEQKMGTLAREAEELSRQQQALADAMREEERAEAEGSPQSEGPRPGGEAPPPGDSAGSESSQRADAEPPGAQAPSPTPEQRAEQQDEMGERAQRLNESMQQLQQQLLQIGERDAAQSTGAAQQKGESAQQSMQEAAAQARDQQGNQASESGARAASQMGEAAAQLESARESMTEGWEREVREAVQQATQDALSLAQREEALRRQMEQAQQQGSGEAQGQMMQQMQSEQAALQQGLQQLGRNLSDAGQQSGMVNRDVSRSLARAMLNMEQTMRALQEQGQMPVQQAGQTVESLNQLAMSLLQNEGQMQQQAGDPMQQALEQLSQLAREQGSVNGQAGALAPMDLGRQAMTQQLQKLAQQQRGIARRVGAVSEMMGGRENVLGRLDQLSSEADLIAEELDGGRLDPEVRARQERLFNRLLDAGRSLEREEYSDERVGESGAGVDASSPEALDPALLDHVLRYPAPSADRLRTLPPAYRRLILEYFDRLNRAGGGS